MSQIDNRTYGLARLEHAFLLRCEGKKLAEIGTALGVTAERARGMVLSFAYEYKRSQRRIRAMLFVNQMLARVECVRTG